MPINTGGSYDTRDDENNRPTGTGSVAASGSGTGRGPVTSGTGPGPSTSGSSFGGGTSGTSNGGYGGGIMGGDWGGVGSNENIGGFGGDFGGSGNNWSGDWGGIGAQGGFGQLGPNVGSLGQNLGYGNGSPKSDFGVLGGFGAPDDIGPQNTIGYNSQLGSIQDPRDFAINHIMERWSSGNNPPSSQTAYGNQLLGNAMSNVMAGTPSLDPTSYSGDYTGLTQNPQTTSLGGSPSDLAAQALQNPPPAIHQNIAQNNLGAQHLTGETGMYANSAYGQVPAMGDKLGAYNNPNPVSQSVAATGPAMGIDQYAQRPPFDAPVMQGQEIDLTQQAKDAYDQNARHPQSQPVSQPGTGGIMTNDFSGSAGTDRLQPPSMAQALTGGPMDISQGTPMNLTSPGFFRNSMTQRGDPGAQRIARALGYKPPTTSKKANNKKKRSNVLDWNVTYHPNKPFVRIT